jgi:hypothetical protein
VIGALPVKLRKTSREGAGPPLVRPDHRRHHHRLEIMRLAGEMFHPAGSSRLNVPSSRQ